jgi:integrase
LVITVARSYERPYPKNQTQRMIPISKFLRPYLEDAIARSSSDLMFPSAGGKMRTRESDPQKVLRWALGRAGLVEGFDHVCRRCKAQGSPHVERHPDAELRRCPKCGMKLWPVVLPWKMKFHELRHTAGTTMLRKSRDFHRVQRILGHSDARMTTATYAHLIVDDLREVVDAFGKPPEWKDPHAFTAPEGMVNEAPSGDGRAIPPRLTLLGGGHTGGTESRPNVTTDDEGRTTERTVSAT